MKDIDRARLSTDLPYRIAFDRDFIGFSEDDAKVLNEAAPLVKPIIKDIVDNVYSHLFEYSYTKAVFLKKNAGFEGPQATSLEDLKVDDPVIAFRKTFLTVWAGKVFGSDYENPATWNYLDKVGLMHTGAEGAKAFKHRANKEPLSVDLHACSLLLAWVSNVIIKIVLEIPDDTLAMDGKIALVCAVNKIMWIQQDLFARHYVRTDEETATRDKLLAAGKL